MRGLTMLVVVVIAVPSLGHAAAPKSAAVSRGAQIAHRCEACHAVELEGRSRNSAAPPFRTLRFRYNPLGLEQALKRVAKFGHFEMRPQELSEADVADLAAYIATLESPRSK